MSSFFFRVSAIVSLLSIAACASPSGSDTTEVSTSAATAVAKLRVDTTTCEAAKAFVKQHRTVDLYKGTRKIARVVARRSMCEDETPVADSKRVATADVARCKVGYTCEPAEEESSNSNDDNNNNNNNSSDSDSDSDSSDSN